MKLSQLIYEYIAFRKSLGEVARTNGYCLRAFGQAMGMKLISETFCQIE